MISYAEALALLSARCNPLPMESVPSDHCSGRLLAADLLSPAQLPAFDNSAMDGIALYCGDRPVLAGSKLEVAGLLAAGDPTPAAGAAAWQIMTGAALPVGCDAVIPIEQVEVIARSDDQRISRVRLRAEVRAGLNVRLAGQDIAIGELALSAGTLIAPAQRMICAALGVSMLPVRRRARVSLLNTGQELVDDPAQPLREGQIRDCNGPYLQALLSSSTAEVVDSQRLGDDPQTYSAAVERALASGADVIVSSGAVSMGELDFISAALRELGAELVFHKLRIRPGKPVLCAVLPGGCLYFGLPGNPLAAAVGARFLLEPALRSMAGLPAEHYLRLPLAAATRKKPGMRSFLKATVAIDANGQARVTVLSGQESFRIRPLLEANAWAILDEPGDECAAGETVEVTGLYGGLLEGPGPGAQ